MTSKKICFVVAPIGPENSSIRERSDTIFKYVITPSVTPLGYEVQRADIPSEPGVISERIIRQVMDDELVIADLTGGNPNVFYELCLRHAVGKPCIHIIEQDDKIPFDVNQLNIISINYKDLASAEKVKQEIKEQIEVIHSGDFKMMTPLSTGINMQALKESGNLIESSLADIMSKLSHIESKISALMTNKSGTPLGFAEDLKVEIAGQKIKDILDSVVESMTPLPPPPTDTPPPPH